MPFQPIRKAVLPVAGLGTRILPATKVMPKEMLTLVDRPLIQYAIEEARAAGIEEFCFISSKGKTILEDHFDNAPELENTLLKRNKLAELEAVRASTISASQLGVVRQQRPLGLGHAVWCARHFVGDEPFAVLLPDDVVHGQVPCLAQMVHAYEEIRGGNLLAVMDVPKEETSRYGILDVAKDDGRIVQVAGMVEKPHPEAAPSTLSIIGRYILQPGIFRKLADQGPGSGAEIQLTDAMARLLREQPFHGLRFEGTRYDCGTRIGYIEATVAFALARPDLGPELRTRLAPLLRASIPS